jgi:hypothetical protein
MLRSKGGIEDSPETRLEKVSGSCGTLVSCRLCNEFFRLRCNSRPIEVRKVVAKNLPVPEIEEVRQIGVRNIVIVWRISADYERSRGHVDHSVPLLHITRTARWYTLKRLYQVVELHLYVSG